MAKHAKRYYIRYTSDQMVCGSNDHNYCGASNIATARSIARKVKSEIETARNIRVYDIEQEDETGHALCVFVIE